VLSLPTKEERSGMFKVDLIKRTETSLLTTSMERLTNNLMSYMLMNGRVNQPRDNSIQDSDSMLKDHSTLSQEWVSTDILISSTTKTSSSRQEMEEEVKSGTSIKRL
jgi:hypothetical protein